MNFIRSYSHLTVIPVHNVFFNPDSYELSSNVSSVTDFVYSKLPEGRTVRIGIRGEMDYKKGIKYINELSAKRANVVYDFLISKNVDTKNIHINRFTSDYFPLKSNDALNREIIIYEIIVDNLKNIMHTMIY